MPRRVDRQDVVIYRDPAAYTSHPCVARLANGDLLVAFNESLPRRPYLHPPHDPRFINLMVRSRDGGLTWEAPRAVPGYEWTGVECPGLAALTTGEVVLNQWRFLWYPLETAYRRWRAGDPNVHLALTRSHVWHPPRDEADWAAARFPWARGDAGCFVSISTDGGATWDRTVPVPTAPFPRGYSPRPVIELADGAWLLALGSHDDDEACFVVHSTDRGQSWGPPITALPRTPGRLFSEPTALALPDGRLVLLARETSGYLFQSESTDGGRSWTPPVQTPIWGYPAHLIALPDGRLCCVYGYRRPPYGIRACLSEDGGRHWDIAGELIIRDDLPNANLGYPTAAVLAADRVFIAYYGEDSVGVTHIIGSHIVV